MCLMIFPIGMGKRLPMTEDAKKTIIRQDMQRIIQLEQQVHNLINVLDLGISRIYKKDETMDIATHLSNTLGQMDSDLAALIDLLTD